MSEAASPRQPFLERALPDRLVGWLALALLGATLVAIVRGHDRWAMATPAVWAHLLLVVMVLALTPVMLWRAKGTTSHRVLGWVWAMSMMLAAAISFDIRLTRGGGFSVIHLLSLWVLFAVPRLIWRARRHEVGKHRQIVRGLSIFALLVAGSFTFGFHRMLSVWMFH